MIKSIRHKGLKRLFEQDDPSGVNPEHPGKLRNIHATLYAAPTVAHMELQGFGYILLKARGEASGLSPYVRTGVWFFALMMARRKLILSITTERKQLMTMKNPPHPSAIVLEECIQPMGLTITDAAQALGVTRKTLSELVNGMRGMSLDMAVRLAQVFGGTEQGWLVQQAQYDLAHVQRDGLKLKRLALA